MKKHIHKYDQYLMSIATRNINTNKLYCKCGEPKPLSKDHKTDKYENIRNR